MTTEQALLNAYDSGGASAVYAYVRSRHPDWGWATCLPCEDDTPTWQGDDEQVCAVCFTSR
jgi:hypothetical protein